MKKLLVVLLALTVIASFASAADVTIGTWNRLGFMLYKQASTTDADATTGMTPGWGRVALNFAAKADNFGMAVDVEARPNSTIGIGDTCKLYANLLDGKITINIGKGNFDTLRGKIGGGSAVGIVNGGGEDDIFARFATSTGVMTEIKPVDGLYMGVAFSDKNGLASTTYRDIQVGAGYTIEGIGLIRAQFIGGYTDTRAVQAAFAFTGVEGLTVDAGAKFFLGGDDTTNQNFASAAVKYGKDAFGVMVRTKIELPKDPAELKASFGGNVNYKVADQVTLGADFGLSSIAETGKVLAVTPYIDYSVSGGGTISLGVNLEAGLDGDNTFTYGIPLVFTF